MSPAPEHPAPGWYPDPERPGVERWWGGGAWGEQRRPAPRPPAAVAARPGPAASQAASLPPQPLIVNQPDGELPVVRLGRPAAAAGAEEREEESARVRCIAFVLALGCLAALALELAVFMAQASLGAERMAGRAEALLYCILAAAACAGLGAAAWHTRGGAGEPLPTALLALAGAGAGAAALGVVSGGATGSAVACLGALALAVAAPAWALEVYRDSVEEGLWDA